MWNNFCELISKKKKEIVFSDKLPKGVPQFVSDKFWKIRSVLAFLVFFLSNFKNFFWYKTKFSREIWLKKKLKRGEPHRHFYMIWHKALLILEEFVTFFILVSSFPTTFPKENPYWHKNHLIFSTCCFFTTIIMSWRNQILSALLFWKKFIQIYIAHGPTFWAKFSDPRVSSLGGGGDFLNFSL